MGSTLLTLLDRIVTMRNKFIPLLLFILFTACGHKKEGINGDWAKLKKYMAENKKLQPALPGQHRVVFIGDSITEFWKDKDSSFFNGNGFINRGISSQVTEHILVRFRQDVINLKPDVVVILAGINDIAENNGPTTLENTFDNIVSMTELAKLHKIRVALCSVLPAIDFFWRHGLKPAEKVIELNSMLKNYAVENNLVYVDYHSAMVDERKGMNKKYADDEVHPTLAGYKVMEPLVVAGINEALKKE